MSTTYPTHDNLRIPPKPHRAKAGPTPLNLPVQLAFSAVAGFGLAWLLSRLIIG
jgi:hypothetical protein